MPAMTKVKCRCGTVFEARTADVKRGWGKFCSKSCKATQQVKRLGSGSYYNYRNSGVDRDTYLADKREFGGTPQYSRSGHYEGFTMSPEELASGGYGDADWNTPFGDGKD
jgi:hypothetical protein